jgi:ABC-type sugar transport system ATPase subunit
VAQPFLVVHPENIYANREPPADSAVINERLLRVDARKLLASLGISINADALVYGSLSMMQR